MDSLHSYYSPGTIQVWLKSAIPKVTAKQKQEVLARIRAFHYSDFKVRLYGNIVRYYQSFLGRYYEAWSQMALFIIYLYLPHGDEEVWLCLTKVKYTF